MIKTYGLEQFKAEILSRFRCDVIYNKGEDSITAIAVFGKNKNLYIGKYYTDREIGFIYERRSEERG